MQTHPYFLLDNGKPVEIEWVLFKAAPSSKSALGCRRGFRFFRSPLSCDLGRDQREGWEYQGEVPIPVKAFVVGLRAARRKTDRPNCHFFELSRFLSLIQGQNQQSLWKSANDSNSTP